MVAASINLPVRKIPWFRILLVLILLFAGSYMLTYAFSSVQKISLTVFSQVPASLQLYYDSSPSRPKFTERNSSSSKDVPAGETVTLHFRVPHIPLSRLRIDLGSASGEVHLSRIVLHQALGRRMVFDAEKIGLLFADGSPHNAALAGSAEGYLRFVATGDDPYIVSGSGFFSSCRPPLIAYIPVLLLSFYASYLAGKVSKEQFLRFFLPARPTVPPGQSGVILPLDGLRGFAALLVLAEHNVSFFLGAGHSGVLIFFVLSGFLLTRTFVTRPDRLCSLPGLIRYATKRLGRILPMYYFYLLMVYGVNLRLSDFTLHALFIEGLGHLWTMPQEMLFYLVFPVIIAVYHWVLRDNIYALLVMLLAAASLWSRMVPTETLYLYGMMNAKLPWLFSVFLWGAFFSCLYYGKVRELLQHHPMPGWVRAAGVVLSVCIITMLLLFSNGKLLGNRSVVYAMLYRTEFSLAVGILVFLLCASGNTVLARILSGRIISAVGLVSYSLYLIHPIIINLVKKVYPGSPARFFIVLVVSYGFACITYHLIEQPAGTALKKIGA